MSVHICLKLDGVEGESAVGAHDKWIDVLSWNFGMTQSASAHIATGAGTGSADVKDLTVTKYVDKSSPNLLKNCFKGTAHKEATLEVLKVTGTDKLMAMVKMKMTGTVFISSVHTGEAAENDRFVETVSLNFSNVTFDYTPQGKDNAPGAPVSTGDLKIFQGG